MTRSENTIFLVTKTNLEFQLSELMLMTCIQQKGLKKTYQKGKGSLAGGVQNLRVKLSGHDASFYGSIKHGTEEE
ncbi:hypothetical protein MKX03_012671 [Papaver bracteatum]|nr:hypothetical protein MKX03_012671 [Papaver bracteatum]